MKAPQVLLVLVAAVLSCDAQAALPVSDARIPEDDMYAVYSVEEQPALQQPVFPFAPDRLEPYSAPEAEVDAAPHPLSKRSKRSTVVFRPLFATRERDAERREQQDRRREYWAKEERRRSAVAAPAYQPYPAAYGPAYPGAYRAAYPGAYPALGR